VRLDGVDFAELAARHGTPFYLYDMDQALAHARRLRSLLPEAVELFYAVKANANRRVLEAFQGEVDGLDISSGGEITLAQKAGWTAQVMSFAGPGKSEEEIERAIREGVRLLSIESPTELRRAAAIAERLGRTVDVTLRVNPLETPKEFPMKMGGLPSQFGIPEEQIDEVVAEARAMPRIHLSGFHVFSGTNCLEAPAIARNTAGTLAIAARLAEKHDLRPEVVNLGGGFGIPYFAGQPELPVEDAARAFADAVVSFRKGQARFAGTRFLLELGRYLVGDYGVYVTRVIDVKDTRGKRFVILDGGMHHCFPATGNFGQLIKKNYPIANLSRPDAPVGTQELVGPLCTPIDSMARALELPRLEIGDLVAFLKTGAYSFAASPLLFLSHDTPPELVRVGGTTELARERKPATAFA
jgi:diaminopimelate decarboxylase